jgi:hypothetical protein
VECLLLSLNYQRSKDEKRFAFGFCLVHFGDNVGSIASAVSRYAWSPIVWENGRRLAANFKSAAWCVLDYDDGLTTVAQAVRMFADCAHVIGTTKSHQVAKGDRPACDRFRVLLKFERPITDLAAFKASMSYYVSRFRSDDQCVDGARFYWPCQNIISFSSEGERLEIIQPVATPKKTFDFSAYREIKAVPRIFHDVLLNGAPVGKRNSACFLLGLNLWQCGFNADEITAMILKGPMGLNESEVRRSVENGFRAAIANAERACNE